jgi:Raf kinase inhibitor-like YbhB/YbcL family protein
MELKSSAFAAGEVLPARYSCDGEGVNPPLQICNVPAQTRSLALIVDDPDAPMMIPRKLAWVHWVLYDMPPTLEEIAENSSPPGIVGNNQLGKPGWTPPCPPDKEHRYFFKLYALDCQLQLPPGASKDQVEKAMEGHVLAKAELIGRYDRKRH